MELHQIFGTGGGGLGSSTQWKKWTQLDLRVFLNEESNISNNNEKGGQQDQKSKRKVVQIASKVSNDRFLWKNRSTLGQIISGIKCGRNKHVDFNTSSTLPCLKHYSSSRNEETYEMIPNLMYNFIPKCVIICGN